MACNCIGGNPCPCQRGGLLMGRIEFSGGQPIPYVPPYIQELLDKARAHTMTPKEIYEQRISWVMGMVPFDREITREEVVKHLEALGIVDPSPSDSAESRFASGEKK